MVKTWVIHGIGTEWSGSNQMILGSLELLIQLFDSKANDGLLFV